MSAARSSFRPRPLGGFNQGMGDQNEHMDESAMQAAMQQKALAQQTTTATPTPPAGAGGIPGAPATMPGAAPGPGPGQPREVGSLAEELVTRPLQDVGKELKSFVDINNLLGIDPVKDDPQTQAHKKRLHQGWNKLTQEDQAYVQQKFQQETKIKQQEKEAEQLKEQQKAQQSQDLVIPTGVKKGAEGPGGSKKKQATQRLQQDRKTLGGPKGSN
jgi:hypothetical protein